MPDDLCPLRAIKLHHPQFTLRSDSTKGAVLICQEKKRPVKRKAASDPVPDDILCMLGISGAKAAALANLNELEGDSGPRDKSSGSSKCSKEVKHLLA